MQAKTLAALACLSLAGATLPSCSEATTKADVRSTSLSKTPWNDLGVGVYTFAHDSSWPASLVQFRMEHPNLEISAMYSDKENDAYGATSSVVVVTEKRE